jgi:outer membrane protein assembly factor BamB
MKPKLYLCVCAFLFVFLIDSSIWAQDWVGLRGNDGQGSIQTNGLLSRTSDVDLKVRWKTKIGSGYSSVVIADGIVLALYTEPDAGDSEDSTDVEDVAVGIDAESGEKLWRHSLGPFFRGQNGSFDGPLTTPVIHKGKIYGLSPRGQLFCLDLKTGEQQWGRDLVSKDNAPQPMYGFTTSPIVVDDVLIVQLGAEDKSVAGFDLSSGEMKWVVGNDGVSSQSPLKTEFAGRSVVLAVGVEELIGLDPLNGKLIFEYEHQGGNSGSVTPVPIGGGKFMMNLDGSYSIAVELNSVDGSIHASEAWKDRSIKNTYNLPVFVAGNVFGFSTRILTCLDPETGRAIWRSRAPGDGFLIAVDDHLIVSTKKGSLHIAKASAASYQEVTGANIFDDLVWSIPAYSDDSIFVRSLSEIARVDIVAKGMPIVAADSTKLPLGPAFSKFISKVDEATSEGAKSELVDQFFATHETTPVIEGDIVHFVYRGAADDIAVGSDLFGSRQERKMVQVDGTDLFYYSAKLPMDQRINYYFLKDFKPTIDPRNPKSITSSVYKGEMDFDVRMPDEPDLEMSWFAMPEWKRPAYLPLPKKMAGQVTQHIIGESESAVTIDVYTPPGYESDSDRHYPVVYVFGGETARSQGNLARIVDSIFQLQEKSKTQIALESLVVFITTPPMAPPDPKLMSEIIVPYVDKSFATVADRKGRLVVGFGFDGASTFAAITGNPELFSACSVQSPMVFEFFRDAILEGFKRLDQPVNVRIEWGRFDTHSPHENWDMRTMIQSLVNEIKKNENVTISGGMVNDTTGWSSWQNRIDQILNMLND